MDLVPCVRCKRHVGVGESACPFCATALPVQRPQFVFAAKLTRAAIFSAAVVACDSKEAPKPAPAPLQQQGRDSGSDDLEQLLDVDQRTVDHPAPVDAATDAASVATMIDAGVTADAGLDAEQIAQKKRERLIRDKALYEKRKQKELELRRQEELEQVKVRIHQNAKPYGAPPARRRVV